MSPSRIVFGGSAGFVFFAFALFAVFVLFRGGRTARNRFDQVRGCVFIQKFRSTERSAHKHAGRAVVHAAIPSFTQRHMVRARSEKPVDPREVSCGDAAAGHDENPVTGPVDHVF